MGTKTLDLFDFGENENGEYVNLVEYKKQKSDIDEKQFQEWVENHNNPLIKIAYDFLIGYYDLETKTKNEIKEELEWIVEQKIYHYGNLEKGLYVYTLFTGSCWCFVFENENHVMVNLNYIYSGKEVEKYLHGYELIHFNALSVRVYSINGERINQYGEGEKDIRHQVVMNEWQMHKFGENRMKEGKKIKDFYEVAISLPKLIEYWGEKDNG